MSNESENYSDIQNQLERIEATNRERAKLVADFLEEKKQQAGKVLATRIEMGTTLNDSGTPQATPSYLTSHDIKYLSTKENMRLGSEMQFMSEFIDQDTGKLSINARNAAEVSQRAPDWSRQMDLTRYLLMQHSRKFGTLLAVAHPKWVDDPNHENWYESRALKSSINFEPIDNSGQIGMLDLSNIIAYVLDGQHRILGMRGVSELMDGRFIFKQKTGVPRSSGKTHILKEDFLEKYQLENIVLQTVMEEKIAVEYIPAVIKGETRKQASERVRSIFNNINKYAKKTVKGEEYLLDENDGFAIAARTIAGSHKIFGHGKAVEWKNTGLPVRSNNLTTLTAVRGMVSEWLKETNGDLFDSWSPESKDSVPERPIDTEIDAIADELSEVLDKISDLPTFKKILNGAKLDPLREFPDEADEEKKSFKGHILLRPHGQEILIGAIGRLKANGMSLKDIFEKLNTLDSEGGFEAHNKSNVWFRVTYDSDKKKMIVNKKELGIKLLSYLISGADVEEQRKLLHEVKEVRKNFDDQHKGEWYNFDGKSVKVDDRNSDLPNVVR